MLLFDMDSYVQQWNVFEGSQNKTHYSNDEIRLCQFYYTTRCSACISIFFTNAHKLVFRFLSPKNVQRQSTPRHTYLKQRARSSDYFILFSFFFFFSFAILGVRNFLPFLSSVFSVFVVIVVVDVITTADYVWVLWTHLVNSLIFHSRPSSFTHVEQSIR